MNRQPPWLCREKKEELGFMLGAGVFDEEPRKAGFSDDNEINTVQNHVAIH